MPSLSNTAWCFVGLFTDKIASVPNCSFRSKIFKGIVIVLALASFYVVLYSAPHSTSATPATFTLSVNSPYGSTIGSGNYPNGTKAAFGVFPTAVYSPAGTVRYVFLGWTCKGVGCYSGPSSSSSVVMYDNITENANWGVQYLLSTSVTGNGNVNPSGDGWYYPHSIVTVSETPQAGGWFFGYWSLDGQNAGSSQSFAILVNSPHSLVANFIKPEIESRLSNVSDTYGNNLRNPDGTFYSLDEFKIQYDALIVGGNQLPSSVLFAFNIAYPHNLLSEIANGSGYAIFVILPGATIGPNNVTISASIFNSADNSNRTLPILSNEPFAVVRYSPHFTHLTYMDYNELSSSSYERAFIVLLRYDGNSPGYSYVGDANTDPFGGSNMTGERAIVNNFTFSTTGWSISANLSIVNDSMDVVTLLPHPGLGLKVGDHNHTKGPDVITWANRVQKFYFLSDVQQIKTYVSSDSISYFNVTVDASYSARYHSIIFRANDFSASYLYEPIFFNGYLLFKSHGGALANFTVTVISENPSPLDARLNLETSSIFGNDSQVLNSLGKDLYPANSTTVLKPRISNSTEWLYLINQTNLALPSMGELPHFTISVEGNTGFTEYNYQPNNPPYYLSSPTTYYNHSSRNITYDAYVYYSLFELEDLPSSFPFTSLMGYNLIQPSVGENLILQPLNFSFTFPIAYLLRTYGNASAPFFVTNEPGNLTNSFPMIFGENQTTEIFPYFAGGGVIGLDGNPVALDGGTSYQVSLLMGNESGGASYVWIVNDRGQVLYNESLPPSSLSVSSLGASGDAGEITFRFPVASTNNSVTIYVENAWGGVNVITGVLITPASPPTLLYSPMFLGALLILAFVISSGYTFFSRRS